MMKFGAFLLFRIAYCVLRIEDFGLRIVDSVFLTMDCLLRKNRHAQAFPISSIRNTQYAIRNTFIASIALTTLTACGLIGQPTPQPLPTVVLDGNRPTSQAPAQSSLGGVVASGKVVPAQQAQLAATLGGNAKAVNVAVGDAVKAGQVLVSLAGSERLTATVAAANLELLAARQALAALNDNAGQARAVAQQNLSDAQKALKDAQDNRYRKNLARVTQATLDRAQADLIISKDVLKSAQENFDKYVNRAENDVQRAQAFSQLAAAQQKVDQNQWNLDWLLSRPDEMEIKQADAAIAVAQAKLDTAQREADRLKNGPDSEALALAKARLDNAQAQVTAAQAALADLEVKAPFAGIITKVNVHTGEWIVPGQPILVLVDLEHLQIETTDLSERDVPKVQVGQSVTVSVKALNQNLTGRVKAIAPLADTLGGDVVYKTTIDLDTIPAALRAGMSVEVQYR
jgi:multidrug resistance efflux pump